MTPVGPGNFVGPGLPVTVTSDFSGTLDPTTNWSVFFYSDSDRTKQMGKYTTFSDTLAITFTPFPIEGADHENDFNWLADGATVYWDARLDVEGTTVDESNGSEVWTNTVGLYMLLQDLRTVSSSGGLTTTDRTNISTAASQSTAAATDAADILGKVSTVVTTAAGTIVTGIGNIFTPVGMDALTLHEITSGETCDPVFASDLQFFFGIVVQCTTVPGSYGVGGLDGRHFDPQLALLNVFRGTEMVARHPIHVQDFMLTPVPGMASSDAAQIIYYAISPNLSLEVWWGPGVCGRVYLLLLP